MSHGKVLIVEDDGDINRLLAEILRQGGYTAVQAYSGTEAKMLLEREQESYATVLLDLMLPGMTGEELLPMIRARGDVPVIVLSARETPEDKINALRGGADDYMTKPFHSEELLARIEAHLRRAGGGAAEGGNTPALRWGGILLHPEARTVEVDGKPVTLTAREFSILELLMGNPKKVFTKANIFRSVWNDEFMGDDNTVNVHISNLRAKLGEGEYIQTVWGIGFKMKEMPGE